MLKEKLLHFFTESCQNCQLNYNIILKRHYSAACCKIVTINTLFQI
jgi:hypothetical protein